MKSSSNKARGTRQGSIGGDDSQWDAIVRRDVEADGKFYYSVSSTGVYCRPSCGARLPRRENVRFHASCDAAETAGFRPCKRCRPNGASVQSQHATAVAKACRIMQDAEEPPKLAHLARAVGVSPFHFQRIFTQALGVTPRQYADALRAQRLRDTLPSRASVTEAIYAAGYNSSSRFYEKASSLLGMSPKRFRGKGDGVTIRFAIGQCLLGSVLVASTDKGICAILLDDDPDALLKDLQDRFPKAELVGGDRNYERVVAHVVGLVEQPHLRCNLPLDVQGTAFQQRVWAALRRIPAGKTSNYTEVAKIIGAPKSVRAVARAIASNPVAVVVPCHRVKRLDGSLCGYRWGVERKRALLEREQNPIRLRAALTRRGKAS